VKLLEQFNSLVFLNSHCIICFLLGNSPASEFRRWGITQKKTHNRQNMAKVWNQEGCCIVFYRQFLCKL